MARNAKAEAEQAVEVQTEPTPVLTTYKGFNPHLRCRDFQFEVGKTYTVEGDIKVCENGFHACEHPFDVWSYYPLTNDRGQFNRWCVVEQSGATDHHVDDTKIASASITIKAELSLPDFVKRGVDYILSQVNWTAKEANTGDQSAAINTGNQSAAINTGYQSAATNTGYQSAAINTGNQSAAINTGYQSAATNTGNQSAATNTGYQSAATNTGDQSAAINTGNQSAAINTGDQSAAINTGYQSAATNTGYQSAATNTGYRSAATNTGYQSAATNTGNQSAAINTGYRSAATNTGYQSAAINTGDQSAAINTGDQSAAINTGDQSVATVEGKDSVALSSGYQGRVSGATGCAIFLVERDDNYKIIAAWAGIVGKDGIKANTFYLLKGGKPVEVEKEGV